MDDAIKKMLDRLDVLIGKGHVKRFPKVCADTVRRDEIRQIAKDLRSKLTEGTGGKEEKRFFRVATAEGVSNFSDIKQANDAYAGFLQADPTCGATITKVVIPFLDESQVKQEVLRV